MYDLLELTRGRLAQIAPQALALLPVGSVEQHGPHLPVGADTIIVDAIARRAAAEASSKVPIVLCPVVSFGSSDHHLYWCAASLSNETLIDLLSDVVSSLHASGFREILILNSHGGNVEAARIVTRKTPLKRPVVVGTCNYWDVAERALEKETDLFKIGVKVPGHAGYFETSLMLALKPNLVDLDLLPPAQKDIPAEGATGVYLQRPGHSVGTDGHSGDAHLADAKRGEVYLNIIVIEVAKAFVAFHAAARG
jgi:creatinine amidohydrolase